MNSNSQQDSKPYLEQHSGINLGDQVGPIDGGIAEVKDRGTVLLKEDLSICIIYNS